MRFRHSESEPVEHIKGTLSLNMERHVVRLQLTGPITIDRIPGQGFRIIGYDDISEELILEAI